MAIKAIINGIEFTCDTAKEARELAGLPMSNGSTTRGPEVTDEKRRPGRPRGSTNGESKRQKTAERHLSSTLQFLKLIERKGAAGAANEDLVGAMNLKGSRGVGGALVAVGRILNEYLALNPSQVFKMTGHGDERRWIRKRTVTEAIQELELSTNGGGS